jgi:hypothetical protein
MICKTSSVILETANNTNVKEKIVAQNCAEELRKRLEESTEGSFRIKSTTEQARG